MKPHRLPVCASVLLYFLELGTLALQLSQSRFLRNDLSTEFAKHM